MNSSYQASSAKKIFIGLVSASLTPNRSPLKASKWSIPPSLFIACLRLALSLINSKSRNWYWLSQIDDCINRLWIKDLVRWASRSWPPLASTWGAYGCSYRSSRSASRASWLGNATRIYLPHSPVITLCTSWSCRKELGTRCVSRWSGSPTCSRPATSYSSRRRISTCIRTSQPSESQRCFRYTKFHIGCQPRLR